MEAGARCAGHQDGADALPVPLRGGHSCGLLRAAKFAAPRQRGTSRPPGRGLHLAASRGLIKLESQCPRSSCSASLFLPQCAVQGFAERKVLLVRQVVKACKDHHNGAAHKERLAALKGTHSEQRLYGGAMTQRAGSQSPPAASKGRAAPAKVVVSGLPPLACTAAGDGTAAGAAEGRAAADCVSSPTAALKADQALGRPEPAAGLCQQPLEAAAPAPGWLASAPAPEAEEPRPLPLLFLARQGTQAAPRLGWLGADMEQAAAAGPQFAAGMEAAAPAALSSAGTLNAAGAAMPQVLPVSSMGPPVAPAAAATGSSMLQQQPGQAIFIGHFQPEATSAGPQPSASPAWGPDGARLGFGMQPQAAPAYWQTPLPPPQQPGSMPTQPYGGAAAWQQHPLAVPAAAGQLATLPGQQHCDAGLGGASARRLIEDLQLRLQLAEETALSVRSVPVACIAVFGSTMHMGWMAGAGVWLGSFACCARCPNKHGVRSNHALLLPAAATPCRHTTEQVREGLQARIAVLEGRVKFLEAGFGLQPQGAPQLLLPWGSPPKTPPSAGGSQQQAMGQVPGAGGGQTVAAHRPPPLPPAGSGNALGGARHLTSGATQSGPQLMYAGAACSSSNSSGATPHAPPPQQQQQAGPRLPGHYVPVSLRHRTAGLPPCGVVAASGSHAPPSSAAAGAPLGSLQPQLAEAAEAPGAARRSFSSTSELISSMHSRFSEAEEFLQSLRRH